MAPIPGWYPDPTGSEQLRFWDGQNWTSSTGPAPRVHQPEPPAPDPFPAMAGAGSMGTPYGAPPGQLPPQAPRYGPGQPYGMAAGYGVPGAPGSAAPPWQPQPSRPSNRWKIGIACVVAVGIVGAITVPNALSSHSSALSHAFDRSLLTPAAVSALANGTFTIDTSKDTSSNDSSSGCMDAVSTIANSGKDRGEASRQYVAADHSTFIEEDLSNNTSNTQQLNVLKDAVSKCTSTTIDGTTVSIQALPAPTIEGSSDTLAMRMSGQVNGNPLVIELGMARFGDNVVVITCGGIDTSISADSLTNSLLTEAVLTARPAFPKS